MVGTPIPPTLRTFLDDLVAVREDRGIAREALHQATKINLSLIEQFEQTALFDHPLFNQVYQRAILLSYARTMRLDEALLSRAFDSAIAGGYRRELAIAFLGLPPLPEVEPPVDSPPAQAAAPDRSAPPRGRDSRRAQPSSASAPSPGRSPAGGAGVASGDVIVFRLEQVALRVGKALNDAVQQLLLAINRTSGGRGVILQWGGILATIVIGLTLLIQFIQRPSREGGGAANIATLSDAVAGVDTARATETPTPASSAPITLSDSLSLVIMAQKNKLDPFRVQVDRDLRRPYWLDQGDTLQFTFADRITVEDRLEDMTVLLEGHPYPLVPADTSGRVIINRDSVRVFLAERRDGRPR